MGLQQREQQLAHVLLTELLAYQFAMPVRWSETQSVLFDKVNVEKLVEFGPSPTLLNMAKKTLGQFNLESDAVNGIKRSLLSTSANYDDLLAETSKSAPEAPIASTASLAKADTPIPDVPITALESVKALVSSSLKKPASDIKLDDSIKAVSGGRSIVQNETIGDMLEEFGPLADDVENIPLKELAATIQSTYDGKLKCLRTRIEKMVGSKMPGSFDLIAARSYLSEKWDLAPGRQDAVLLIALDQQPTVRLKRNEDAEAFFDTIARGYLDRAGLSRQISVAAASPQHAMLYSKVVQQLREEHSQLRRKIATLFADDEEPVASSVTGNNSADIQDNIDTLEKELGEDFCNGIRPIFKASHQRSYNSVWNWSHVDLLDEYYRLKEKNTNEHDPQLAIANLRNRASSRLERARKYLLSKISSSEDGGINGIKRMLDSLSPEATNPLNNEPRKSYESSPLKFTHSTPNTKHLEADLTKSPHIPTQETRSFMDP
ncbi:hypothetical protein F5Y06DRAFT_297482 [Hypoxylon sp. FL0890]|nr:hypothetical protein F5Y06DRAFT_297482 [Hypoxylon sp. FL0890]